MSSKPIMQADVERDSGEILIVNLIQYWKQGTTCVLFLCDAHKNSTHKLHVCLAQHTEQISQFVRVNYSECYA